MKYFKLIGILSLLVFSFYLTDWVTNLALNTSPIMKEIKYESKNYACKSVNATIENNTIIPGIKGKEINEVESFLKMKDFGAFNENYLTYNYIKPDISIDDNKDKIIISGNKSLRYISIILDRNEYILNYLKENNIKFSKIIKLKDELLDKEVLNGEREKEKFKSLNHLINKKKLNKKICILNYSNIEECNKLKYYIVNYNYELTNKNFYDKLNEIGNGNIILVSNNITLDNFKIFLEKIKTKDLQFKYLSEIIEE